MTNYEDDNMDDEVEGNEPTDEEEGGAAPSNNNRNFLLALGGMGLIFLLLVIAFLVYWFSTPRPQGTSTANLESTQIVMTNVVIATSNEQTAAAATQAGIALSQTAAFLLTPSITPTASNTPVLPTATKTPVVAQATASNTPLSAQGGGGGVPTATPNLQTRTATIAAALTQNAQQTQTQIVKARLTGTATALPKTGFAEDVGLPGLFGLAIGLVLVIVLVRRLRLSTNG